MWIVVLIIGLGALWDGFTTFFGIVQLFDIFAAAKVNPFQVIFAVVVSLVVFGFIIATHVIWSFTDDDLVTLLLRIAWFICLGLDIYTSLLGNRHYVFNDRVDTGAHVIGLFVVTFLITAASILLSRLLLSKDSRGKGYLF